MAFKKVAASGDFQTIDHLVGPAVICAADFDDAFVLVAQRDTRIAAMTDSVPEPSIRNISHAGICLLISLQAEVPLRGKDR